MSDAEPNLFISARTGLTAPTGETVGRMRNRAGRRSAEAAVRTPTAAANKNEAAQPDIPRKIRNFAKITETQP
jgi:hypothetical protein